MSKKRTLVALLMAIVLVFSLAACGGGSAPTPVAAAVEAPPADTGVVDVVTLPAEIEEVEEAEEEEKEEPEVVVLSAPVNNPAPAPEAPVTPPTPPVINEPTEVPGYERFAAFFDFDRYFCDNCDDNGQCAACRDRNPVADQPTDIPGDEEPAYNALCEDCVAILCDICYAEYHSDAYFVVICYECYTLFCDDCFDMLEWFPTEDLA